MLNNYYRTKGYVRENMIYYSVNIEWRYMGFTIRFNLKSSYSFKCLDADKNNYFVIKQL
jgi:hypothetical protein